MRHFGSLVLAAAASLAFVLLPGDAAADGLAYPSGKLVRVVQERAIVVWERARKVEHVIRKVDFEGEAASFATLIATPAEPKVAKVKDDVFARIVPLVIDAKPTPTAPEDGPALPKSKIDGYEVTTIKANDAALTDWLTKNKLENRAPLAAWIKKYATKNWYVTALRYTGVPTGVRTIQTPAIVLTFASDTPIYPYGEATPPRAEQQVFADAHKGFRNANGARALDIWFVGDDPMAAFQRVVPSNPAPSGIARADDDALATALGDSKGWDFDPHQLPHWTVTHMHETGLRFAVEDLVFQVQDDRAHTTFPGDAGAPPGNAETGTATSARPPLSARSGAVTSMWKAARSPAEIHRTRARRFVFAIAALAVLLGLLVAYGADLRARRAE